MAFVLPPVCFLLMVKHDRCRSLVCDMPSSKRLEPLQAGTANMSQQAGGCVAMQPGGQKRGPGKPGPRFGRNREHLRAAARRARISQAGARQVAVTDRDPGAGHQGAIQRGQEAAKQAGMGGHVERSGLGHRVSPEWRLRRVLI